MKVGIDIGSTTIKCVVLDDNFEIKYKNYERHYSKIKQKTLEILKIIRETILKNEEIELAITGSAGMGLAENLDIPFIQEVYATKIASQKLNDKVDTIIELGGEDAKILFLSGENEIRMNGTCAGGTGAFIDQMATLLNVSTSEINNLAINFKKIYPIASRCGVFAKTDIQPLLNQGASKSDLAKSIFESVVNQTISGLAQGRKIEGKILYLGGPLTFMSELRKSFDSSLNLNGICPENSLFYVAIGTAICANKKYSLKDITKVVENYQNTSVSSGIKPLFKNESDYKDFILRHNKASILKGNIEDYQGNVYLGIDAGSTTLKMVVMGENFEILHSDYMSNSGDIFLQVKKFLENLYNKFPNLKIKSSAVTGYGEELIKNAFSIDFGVVETVAHLTAAKKFMPDVEFIIDIGGQDIKCFKVRNGVIDNIFLNEACSSGCGSFLQTMANTLNCDIHQFSKLGIKAKHPVDLGSRCTVFMNSSVKQAQKDGATIEDISAGLSISVIKNAIYKVIRAGNSKELGKKIVVQGGTFLNDAVLRAFEKEMGTEVIRPKISGLMGAYGAAIFAKEKNKPYSSIVSKKDLKNLTHEVVYKVCKGCSNNCKLNINKFSQDRIYVSGNKCERVFNKASKDDLNIYAYKLDLLKKYSNKKGTRKETIGIPMVLNMFELLPFWHTFFSSLGFNIIVSPVSDSNTYTLGNQTIPSDTVCFPAKLVHGHIQKLINYKVKNIFYPCMSYNLNEGLGDNHYNCPVVAYYPEVIASNIKELSRINFIKAYVGLHRRQEFFKKIHKILSEYFDNISVEEIKRANKLAFSELNKFKSLIKQKGKKIIEDAKKLNKEIIVLAGRPYHIDPQVNHGIDKLISSFGVAIISEDVLSKKSHKQKNLKVLNQWAYHSRLYSTAQEVLNEPTMHLVQLVSFGCGIDAITTDEIRDILESKGRIYTQLKIDEITNLGAIKIRLRSLLAAIEQKRGDIKCQNYVMIKPADFCLQRK